MKSKVSLIECKSYDTEQVYQAVKASVDLLGGIESIVRPGKTVLIKPNLLSAKPPETGIDTHPEVVRAVIRLVKQAGGKISVGDSPGGSVKKMSDVYTASGIEEICLQENVEIINFDRIEVIKGIPIAKAALETDVLISLPKFKTHSLMTLTAGVKNLFGVVPGLFKTECHKMEPKPNDFASLLVDIYSYAKPHLSIVDGIIGMEGDGPATGGILKNINLIAASTDAVSLDAVLTSIIGLKPFDISTTREADRRGLGIGRMDSIEIAGSQLADFIQKDFKLPKTSILHNIPNPLLKIVAKFFSLKPDVTPDKCKDCGICVKSCPKQAITVRKGRIEFDYSKCILCLCCHEFCPENAIFIKENIFVRMIRR